MEKLLTFSVAAYNVEKYLDKLFNSILSVDKLDRVEVLIINDGSKDKTAEITKKYENLYPDIVRLIDKENGGHGSTINRGIQEATGKYFRALDGDDWIDTNGLERLLECISNIDSEVILMDYITCYEGGEDILEKVADFSPKKELLLDAIISNIGYMRYHSVIYNTNFLKSNHIKLDENCFYVDTEFMLYPMKFIKTLTYLDWPLYCYRIGLGEQSVSANGRKKHIKDSQKVGYCLLNFYKTLSKITRERRAYIENGIAAHCSFHINSLLLFNPSSEIKKEIIEFDNYIKSVSEDIYDKVSLESKSIKLMRKTNYAMYRAMAMKKKLSKN